MTGAPWRRWITRGALATALVAGTAFARVHLPTERTLEDGELFVPQPEVARVASLGFRNLVSDYYWLQALQVLGAATTDPSQNGPVFGRLLDVVTDLDPHVDHPYRFAGIWMTDSPESVRKADALLERGIEYHPDDWRNHFYQGFNRFFYLEENERAADALEKAAAIPGSPKYLPRLVARLRAGESGLDTSAAMLTELVHGSEDPFERAEYEKALDEVETERRARVLDAAREEFQRRFGQDIERVEDLAAGPEPVLAVLPPEIHGWEWVIEPRTGRIVSSWYGARYEPQLHAAVQREREAEAGQRLVPIQQVAP